MPTWMTQKLPIGQWGAIQYRVEVVRQELGEPLHLTLLVKRGNLGQPDDVFLMVPDDSLNAKFPGFSDIAESDIPSGLTMLVGPDAFNKLFPEIAAKLQQVG